MKSELFKKEQDKARALFPEAVVRFIEECMARKNPNSQLIPVLHKVQDHFGYLSQEHMDAVSVLMQIPRPRSPGWLASITSSTSLPGASTGSPSAWERRVL